MTIDDIRNKYTINVAGGSGVLVKSENEDIAYIFTNYHVIEGKKKDDLLFSFQDEGFTHTHPITVVRDLEYYDEVMDAAIIVIQNNFRDIECLGIKEQNVYKGNFYHVGFPECRRDPETVKSIVHNIVHVDGEIAGFIEYENSKAAKDVEMQGTSGGGIFADRTNELVGIHTCRSNKQTKEFLGKAFFIPISIYLNLIVKKGLPAVDMSGTILVSLANGTNKRILHKYLNIFVANQERRLSVVRTFLYWNEDKTFEEVYYPISLKAAQTKKQIQEIITIKDCLDPLLDCNDCISIMGNAGSGKTMLMKHLFFLAAKGKKYIPIMVELRRMKGMTLLEYISELLFVNKPDNISEIIDNILRLGNLLFFFDGYDELSQERRERLIGEIERFLTNYPKNRIILTSRKGTGADIIPGFAVYNVCPLSKEDIPPFVKMQLKNLPEGAEYIEKLLELINDRKHQHYQEYIENPLLLSMVILSYLDKHSLPTEQHLFYSEVFDTFAYRHDTKSKPGSFDRKTVSKTKLQRDKIQKILETFSILSYCNEDYSFNRDEILEYITNTLVFLDYHYDEDDVLSDLQIDYSMIIEDGGIYSFPHRSLQEYFLASFIKKSEDKKDLYKRLLELRNPDHSLWSLLSEMDKVNFMQYYMIPRLSAFVSKMESDSSLGNSLIERFVSFFNLQILVTGSCVFTHNEELEFLIYSNVFEPLAKANNLEKEINTIYKNLQFFSEVQKGHLKEPFGKNFVRDKKLRQLLDYVEKHSLEDCMLENSPLIHLYNDGNEIADFSIYSIAKIMENYGTDSLPYVKDYIESFLDSVKRIIKNLREECTKANDKDKRFIDVLGRNKRK